MINPSFSASQFNRLRQSENTFVDVGSGSDVWKQAGLPLAKTAV